jgi:hypothetical protein
MNTNRLFDRTDKCGPVRFEVHGRKYKIYNLGYGGMAVIIDKKEGFSIGDLLYPIKVNFGGKPISLVGKIVHITAASKYADLSSIPDKLICGIQFIYNGNAKERERLKAEMEDIISSLF